MKPAQALLLGVALLLLWAFAADVLAAAAYAGGWASSAGLALEMLDG